jgi:triosephosphate isomerase (TIM)
MRHRFVVANWKMNLPPEGIDAYCESVNRLAGKGAALVIAPPYPYLERVRSRLGAGVETAAQNCADHENGAFTGEVAPAMLRDLGIASVILGHSERRSLYGETDERIARKLVLALQTGLKPIVCIGESLRDREGGKTARVLADQIRACSHAGLDSAAEIILAYEPIWAIGTGRNATGLMVAETLSQIREALSRFWPESYSAATPILYGGSVTPQNVGDLAAHGGIDGFLVGGASLDSAKFAAIHAGMK